VIEEARCDEARLIETLQSYFISKDAYEALKQDISKNFSLNGIGSISLLQKYQTTRRPLR